MNLIEEHYTATTMVIQPELLLGVITCQPGAHNWVHGLFGTMIVRFFIPMTTQNWKFPASYIISKKKKLFASVK